MINWKLLLRLRHMPRLSYAHWTHDVASMLKSNLLTRNGELTAFFQMWTSGCFDRHQISVCAGLAKYIDYDAIMNDCYLLFTSQYCDVLNNYFIADD